MKQLSQQNSSFGDPEKDSRHGGGSLSEE